MLRSIKGRWLSRLIKKFSVYSIEGVALRLIKSYLENQKQQVMETDSTGIPLKSNMLKAQSGVPQSSILTLLLYILYVSELLDVVSQNV